jgi:hypothetical protein
MASVRPVRSRRIWFSFKGIKINTVYLAEPHGSYMNHDCHTRPTQVCDLVRSRRVYLVRGAAYVPQESLASLVVGIFRSRLSKALAVTARQWSAKLAPMVRPGCVSWRRRAGHGTPWVCELEETGRPWYALGV